MRHTTSTNDHSSLCKSLLPFPCRSREQESKLLRAVNGSHIFLSDTLMVILIFFKCLFETKHINSYNNNNRAYKGQERGRKGLVPHDKQGIVGTN